MPDTSHQAQFIARVDPDRVCVLRDTEQILLPETGVDLSGGLGFLDITPAETWVISSEMAFPASRRDEPNRMLLAKVLWKWEDPLSNAMTSCRRI